MTNMLLHKSEHLKNYSLSLIWLHDEFKREVLSHENRDCGTAKHNFKYDQGTKCLNDSLYSSALTVNCMLNVFVNSMNLKCFKFTLHGESSEANETEYLIFSYEAPHTNNSINSRYVSWMEASQTCKNQGAMLPYFTNQKDLDQLIQFFKLSSGTFLQEGIFIGLIHNLSNNKVST